MTPWIKKIGLVLVMVFAPAIALVSCSSTMPGARVENPEYLKLIKSVVLGPIDVDESTRAACSWAERAAGTTLLKHKGNVALFSLAEDDSLLRSVRSRVPHGVPDFAGAAAAGGYDGVLLCTIEGMSVEYGQEVSTSLNLSRMALEKDTVALRTWGGVSVTVKVIDADTGIRVIESRVDRMLSDSDLEKIGQFAEYAVETNVSAAVAEAYALMIDEWDWATMNGRPIAAPDSQLQKR